MMRWVPDARCVGRTAYFFGPSGERPEARVRREAHARRLCAACPAREQCRDWAREHQEYGFWGGESEGERVAAGYRVMLPIGRTSRVSNRLRPSAPAGERPFEAEAATG